MDEQTLEWLGSKSAGREWFPEIRNVRVTRGGGMRVRGATGKVSSTYDKATRRRLLQAAAERDARIRAERQS